MTAGRPGKETGAFEIILSTNRPASAAEASSHDDGAAAEQTVLQEVVGIVVVMKTCRPRMDLATLPVYPRERLAAPKWP